MDGGKFLGLHPAEPIMSVSRTVRVHFHGRLRKRFGATFDVGAEEVSTILRVLFLMVPGLRQEMANGRYRLVRGQAASGDVLDISMLRLRIGDAAALHIFPVAAGAGGRGIGKDILGAALIVTAVAVAGPFGLGADIATATGVSAATVGSLAVSVGLMGTSLLLGGISEAISPQPGLGNSYLLNGQVNTSAQGVAIPLVYGVQVRVGTVLVSSSYSAEDYTTGTSDYQGYGAFISDGGFAGNTGALKSFDSGNPLPAGATGLGGGGGGKGSSPNTSGGIEAPNTLESKAIVRLVHVISEGPIGGLINGPQSMYFGQTPLQDRSGGINFRGVAWQFLNGTPDQAPVPGYPSVTETNTVGIQVFASTPVIQTLVSSTADRARVTITIPAMFAENTQNGDVNPGTMKLQIQVQPANGTYSTVVSDIIHGKCTSPYQKSYVFPLPNIGTIGNPTTSWNVQVNKLTPDPSVSTTQNSLYWATYDLITDYQLTYGDTALIALTLDSEAFGTSLPTFTVEVGGIECQVPANYTPATYNSATNIWTAATYATTGTGTSNGTWDGVTFKAVVTSNPAWIFYDFISNNRYGMGLTTAQLALVKYQLYQIGIYCDGNINPDGTLVMIADGYGNLEPRYSLNGVLSQQASAFQIMQAIAATFRGMVYWSAGSVGVTADMPQTPIKILNQADVIGGLFTYEGTSLKTRHTWANVQWQDPAYNYLPAFEPVEYPQQVAQRGIYTKDLLAFGCTSRGVARRLGEWLLYSENYQTETVSFSVTYDKMDLLPGDVVAIADGAYAGLRMGGRLRGSNTTSVVNLDMVFSPVNGTLYDLLVTYPDNTLSATVPINSFATVTKTEAPYALYETFTTEIALSSPLWTFTRGSPGTYFDSTGTMQLAASGVPRFDHTPFVGQPLGLLIEPPSANYLLYGDSFVGYAGACTLTLSSNVPHVRLGIQATEASSCTGPILVSQPINIPATQIWTVSVYVWIPAGYNATDFYLQVNGAASTSTPQARANLALTNQWQRIATSGTLEVGNASFYLVADGATSSTVVYFTAGQVEPGSVLTSYIPTDGVAIARFVDNIYAFMGAEYYLMAGTLVFAGETEPTALPGTAGGISIFNQAAPADGATMLLTGTGGAANISAGGTVTSFGTVNVAASQVVKQAVSWGNGAFQYAVAGEIITIANDVTMPNTNLNNIGIAGLTQPFYVREIVFYPYARTGADLATLSSTAFDPGTEGVVGPSFTQLTLGTALTQIPAANAVYIISTIDLSPTEWQVIGIQETQPGQFRVSGIQYDINKYAIIEANLTFNIPPFSNLAYVIVTSVPSQPPINTATGQPDYLIYDSTTSTFYEWIINAATGIGAWQVTTAPGGTTVLDLLTSPIPAPYNVTAKDSVIGTGTTTLIVLQVSWTQPTDNRIASYQVAVVNSLGVTVSSTTASGSSTTVNGLSPDTYSIGVRSLATNGSTSAWAYTETGTVVAGASNSTPDAPEATSLLAIGGYQCVFLTWTASIQSDVTTYEVWRSSNSTTPLATGSVATLVGTAGGTAFTDSDATVLIANSTWFYWIRAVTTTGVKSGFTGPAQATATGVFGANIDPAAIQSQLTAQGITAVGILDGGALPANPTAANGATVIYDVATGLLYRWNGTAYLNTADAGQLTGTLSSGVTVQGTFSSSTTLPGSQVTGSLGSSVSLSPNQVVGGTIASQNTFGTGVYLDASFLAGTIGSSLIGSGVVQAGNVAFADPSNLALNPQFADSTGAPSASGWTGLTAVARTTSGVPSGAPTPNVGVMTGSTVVSTIAANVPVTAGSQYFFSFYQACPVLANVASFGLYAVVSDAAGNNIYPGIGMTVTAAWSQIGGLSASVLTIPDTVLSGSLPIKAMFYFQLVSKSGVTATVYLSNVIFRKSSSAELIPPGAVNSAAISSLDFSSTQLAGLIDSTFIGGGVLDTTLIPSLESLSGSLFPTQISGIDFNQTGFSVTGTLDGANVAALSALSGSLEPSQLLGLDFNLPGFSITGELPSVHVPGLGSLNGSIGANQIGAIDFSSTTMTTTGTLLAAFLDNINNIASVSNGLSASHVQGTVSAAQFASQSGTAASVPVTGIGAGSLPGNITVAGTLVSGTVAVAGSASSVPVTGIGSGGLPSGVTVNAPNMGANVITAGTAGNALSVVQGGAIQPAHLAIGTGANVIWNSCLNLTAAGWLGLSGATFAVLAGNAAIEPVTGLPYSAYAQGPYGGGVIYNIAAPGVGLYVDLGSWAPNGPNGFTWDTQVPCVPGDYYAAQVAAIAHGVQFTIYLLFEDANGNLVEAPIAQMPVQEPLVRENILPVSSGFAGRYGSEATLAAGSGIAAPPSTFAITHATNFTGPFAIFNAISIPFNGTFTLRVEVFLPAGYNALDCYVTIDGQNGSPSLQAANANITTLGSWQTLETTGVLAAGHATFYVVADGANSSTILYLGAAQLEPGGNATAWIQTNGVPVIASGPALVNWQEVWVSGLAPASAAYMTILLRAFAAPLTIYGIGYTETAPTSVSIAGGAVTFTSNVASPDDTNEDTALFYGQTVTGNFVATAQVQISSANHKIGLAIRDSLTANGCSQINAHMNWQNSANVFIAGYADFLNGTAYPDQQVVTGASPTTIYVQITRTGGAISLNSSVNGTTWTVEKTLTPAVLNETLFVGGVFFSGGATGSGTLLSLTINANPWVAFTQAMLGPSVPNATGPAPWQPGGVTTIDGGQLNTGSVKAVQIDTTDLATSNAFVGTLVAESGMVGLLGADTLLAGSIAVQSEFAQTLVAQTGFIGELGANTLLASSIATNVEFVGTLLANTAFISTLATNTEFVHTLVSDGLVAVNALTAQNLAAGSVTATQLTITDLTNLVGNPSFAAGPVTAQVASAAGWSSFEVSGVTAVLNNATGVPAGAPQIPLNANAFFVGAFTGRDNFYGDWFPCTAGQAFWTSVSIAGSSANTIALGMRYVDSGGAIYYEQGTTTATPSATWTQIEGQVSAPTGTANPIIGAQVWFLVNGGSDIVLPAVYATNFIVRKAASGELLVDGSITANSLAAGSITTPKLAAGSVTTNALAIGNGSNVLWNSCTTLTTVGWQARSNVGTFGIGVAGSASGVSAYGGMLLSATGATQGQFVNAAWYPQSEYVAVIPGSYVQGSAYVFPSNGTAYVEIVFLDINGVQIGSSIYSPTQPTGSSNAPPASLASYVQVWVNALVPASAASVKFIVGIQNNTAGTINLLGYATMMSLGPGLPNASEPNPWVPGGATSFDGGMMTAASITSIQIAGQTIQADNMAANSIGTAELQVGTGANVVSNPSCVVSTLGWTGAGTSPSSFTTNFTNNVAGNYPVAEGGAGAMFAPTLATNDVMFCDWSPVPGIIGVAVQGGQWVEAQTMVSSQRCAMRVALQFFGANNTIISGFVGNRVVSASGSILNNFELSYVIAQAPANAQTALIQIQAFNDGASDFPDVGTYAAGQQAYGFFCRAMLAPTNAGAKQPSLYQPGGITTIQGGWIQANSVTSNEIDVGNLVASFVNTNTLKAVNIDVSDLVVNGMAIQGFFSLNASNQVTISAAQITTGVINGAILQFTDAFITGSLILDGQVFNSNIAANAVSNSYAANGGVGGASITVNVPSGFGVFVFGYYAESSTNNTNPTTNLTRDGTNLASGAYAQGSIAFYDTPAAGSHVYKIVNGVTPLNNCTIFALVITR